MRQRYARRFAARHEQLEPKLTLSAAPVVTGVDVGSSAWSAAFGDYLESSSLGRVDGLGQRGYSIETGSNQTGSLPWTDLDTVSIWFDQDVDVDINDLALTGVNQDQYGFDGFWYDPQLRVATWTLSAPLVNDRLLIDLNADGADPVANLDGDRLDGEWTDTVSGFSSGDGFEGGDFEFSISVLPGDVDQNDWVTYYDYVYTYYGSGLSTTDPGYDPAYDIDGSGVVDTDDYMFVYSKIGDALPTGDPAGATQQAPTAAPNAYLEVQDRVAIHTVDLYALFDDPDDGDASLTYSIVSNSDAALFDSVAFNSTTGELEIDAAATGSGRAVVVVEAADPDGLRSEVVITIDVGRTNAPPEIDDFTATPTTNGTYLIFAMVTDPDDDPVGWTVEISGAIETRAVVWSNQFFWFAVIDDPAEYGSITATVTDPHGNTDTAFAYYGYS